MLYARKIYNLLFDFCGEVKKAGENNGKIQGFSACP
jgi:hypothetical protein